MRTLRTTCFGVFAVAIFLIYADSAAAIKILVHGREAAATFRDDPFILAHLETKYGADNVDYMQGSTAAADGSSATGYDVVFISSSMASSDTRNKYEDSPVGIVCDENALITDDPVGNFGLSDIGGNQDNINGKTKINIVDPTHPLAAGLSGEVTVFNTDVGNWWQFGRGTLAPGVVRVAAPQLEFGGPANVSADYNNDKQVNAADYVVWRKNLDQAVALPNEVATNGTVTPEDYDAWRRRFDIITTANDEQHAILAADVGAQLWGNGEAGRPATAAGRRVFLFVSDFGFFDLTEDGVKLFDAAIEWAAASPAPGGAAVGAVPEPACSSLAVIAGLGGIAVLRRRSATI